MSSEPLPESLAEALQAVQRLIDKRGGRGLVIGGVAVGLVSVPRFTGDVDAVLLGDLDEVPSLVEAAAQQGLASRVSDPAGFARDTRMLLLVHKASGVPVDISLGMLPFEEEAVARSR